MRSARAQEDGQPVIEILGTGWTFRLRVNAIAGGLCVLVALPLCFARINPLLRARTYASEQMAKLEALRQTEASLVKSLARERSRLSKLYKALKTEKIQLDSAGNVNQRIAKLADLAERLGLAMNEVMPGQAARAGPYDAVPVSLLVSGKYPTCVAFLRKLKETFPDTSVDSFELSSKSGKSSGTAEFRLKLLWYTAAEDRPAKE